MDFAELETQLRNLGVRPIDPLRASLYIDYLDQAKTYFHTTLAGQAPNGLGPAYRFVQTALRSANLLQELADILDFFVSPAIDADLKRVFSAPPGNRYTYRQYFDNVILNNNAPTYDANVLSFRSRYPISRDALAGVFANFERNIKQACERIHADQAMLTILYQDLFEDDFAILHLSKIKSTGSDFHHGGQQVLILTFDVVESVDYGPPIGVLPRRGTLRVVYKPSDIEVDCLIAGDSAPVNRALGNQFMAASLFEIYNTRLQAMKTANPAFTGLPLSTYRVLPRNYLSGVGNPAPLPIREAYGYIEYLDNDLSGTAPQVFGYYPFASSDYLIFRSDDETAIVTDFYRREGALCAVAGSFSLHDMHIENVRVMSRLPHLIDLEISLTSAVSEIESTLLLGRLGGITGINVDAQDFVWHVENPDTQGQAYLGRKYEDNYYQNRLWRSTADGRKQMVPIDRPNLVRGFNDGMSVLRAGQQNGDFNAWFARLDNVLVRYTPYGTSEFKNVRTQIFIDEVERDRGWTLQEAQQEYLIRLLTDKYDAFAAAGNRTALPDFVALTQEQSGPDYLNLDIPIFYHRIGTTGIVNSRGEAVPIPPTVTVQGKGVPPNPPTRQARVLGVGGVLARDTFFPAPPTHNVVHQSQVTILGGPQYDARVNTLKISIGTYFGDNTDNSAQAIVPI